MLIKGKFLKYCNTMEYFSKKEIQKLESTKNKDLLDLSDQEWNLRHITYDLERMQRLAEIRPETIYTILRSVSGNGMNRVIDLFFVNDEKKPEHLHFYTTRVFQKRVNTAHGWGYRVGGCGMDMGFHLVNSLSYSMSHFLGLEKLNGYIFRQEWF